MLEVKKLSKIYKSKNVEVHALDDINLKIQEKGMVFILGKSGSGKSTLLNVLGGLDQFSEGEIIISGKSSKDFKQSDFDSYRNTFVGFIFQEYNVMNNFTVKENIALALQLQGKKVDNKVIQDILEEVDLQGLEDRKPNELSGGQLQRVAIARALIKNPEIIMADEPTGALDSRTGVQVFDTLKKLSKDKLVLIVSHDKEFAKNYADRIIELADGKIISDTSKEHIAPKQMNEGISFIENEFINIQDSQNLTDEDILNIIKELKKQDGETIISFNQNTNKEIKKTNHVDEQGRLEVFNNTTDKHLGLKDYTKKGIHFIKSKLPFRSSLKLALSNLRLKPFRLFITIMLSVVSFTLFGFANTIAEYDKEVATFNSMKDSQVNYLTIGKEEMVYGDGYSYANQSKLNQNDIKSLKKKYPKIPFTNTFTNGNYNTSLDFVSNVTKIDKMPQNEQAMFYPINLSAIASIDQQTIKENKFTLTGSLPENDKEIALTEFVATTFKTLGYQVTDSKGKIITSSITNSKDLIGKTITLKIDNESITYKITGIIDTHIDLSRFESLKDEEKKSKDGVGGYFLISELDALTRSSFHSMGYVHQSVLEKAIHNYHVYSTQAHGKYLSLIINDNYGSDIQYFHNYNDINKESIIEFNNGGNFYINYNSIRSLTLSKNVTLQDYVSQNITDPSNEKQVINAIKDAVIKYKDQIIKAKITLSMSGPRSSVDNLISKIAGVYLSPEETQEFVLTDSLIKEHGFTQEGYASFIVSNISDDKTLKDIISYTYDDGINDTNYTLINQIMPMLTTVNSIISTLQTVFLFIGIGFAVFAAAMFCNFIATSIANKKREIGILRAVGARGTDVLKIFLNESLMIAGINWIFAVITCGVGTILINQYIRNEFGILVTILDFGLLQIIFLLLISVSVAIIASALPVYNISKKKPIDAIKDRK